MQERIVENTQLLKIGQAAQTLGINPKTIRYYEEIGLIPEAPRNNAGYRLYDQAAFDRLSFILRARRLDFSLDDIGEILALREDGEAPCLYVTGLVDKRISDIDTRIDGLNQLRLELEDIREEAKSLPREDIVRKDCICHLIENEALVPNGAPQ
ncbi:MAG: heavy metal-responsive transcriptional regulator [Anaerolineales bacterium]